MMKRNKDKKEPDVEQSDKKAKKKSQKAETKKNAILNPTTTHVTQEENDNYETEASSTPQLQFDPFCIEDEEPEDIILIGKDESNDTNDNN